MHVCTYTYLFFHSNHRNLFLIGYKEKDVSTAPLMNFELFENVGQAFQNFTTAVASLLRISNIAIVRRACISQAMSPSGIRLPFEFVEKIKQISNIDSLIDELTFSGYWTWIDTRVVEAMAAASISSTPKTLHLIKQYKSYLYPKKLSEVLTNFPDRNTKTEYVRKVSCKVNKFVDDTTIQELLDFKRLLETIVLDIRQDTLTLDKITEGCIVIHCYIPIQLFTHAYQSSLKKTNKFSRLHIRYLDFNGYPKIYSLQDTREIHGGLLLSLPSTGMLTAYVFKFLYCLYLTCVCVYILTYCLLIK